MATMRDSSKRGTDPATPLSRGRPGQKFLSPRNKTWGEKRACLRELDSNTRILVGCSGDHPLVLKLLGQALQCPLSEDFQSRLDEPAYEPSDRVLIYRKDQLVGHVRVSKQIGWFRRQRLPLAMFQDFFTLPEFEAANYDDELLEAAESTAVREGSLLGLIRTSRPEWFQQHGWSCCYGQGTTRANTMAILSHFDAQAATQSRRLSSHLQKRHQSIEVRSWRHFELDSLRKIYEPIASNMWGSLTRSEETWQWLVGRKAQDQILIAVEKPKKTPKQDATERNAEPNVVGYAIVRDSCIVEMLTLSGYAHTRPMLVARACRDAIDRDHNFVSLLTPANDPMHEFLVTAGGHWINDIAALEGKWMLKLLSPTRWCERLYPLLQQRAEQAGIARPVEVDFACGKKRHRLMLTRRSSRLETFEGGSAAPGIQCGNHTFQDILTSNLPFAEALKQNRVQANSDEVLSTLAALFPPELFWQSPFPLLRL